MPRGDENARGVFDADDLVAGRVHHQQRLAEVANLFFEPLGLGVLHERAPDPERPAGKRDLGFAARANGVQRLAELMQHMGNVGRRADGDHRLRFGNAVRRRQHGGAAERMADQDRRRFECPAQVVGRAHQVIDVRRKIGVGEIAFGRAKPGEIESQHADAGCRQRTGNAPRGQPILRAGEAVSEQRERPHRTGRQIESRRQLLAAAAGKRRLDDRCRGHGPALHAERNGDAPFSAR